MAPADCSTRPAMGSLVAPAGALPCQPGVVCTCTPPCAVWWPLHVSRHMQRFGAACKLARVMC
eukprot:109284-Chlamydomonas_euryale.AAC.1